MTVVVTRLPSRAAELVRVPSEEPGNVVQAHEAAVLAGDERAFRERRRPGFIADLKFSIAVDLDEPDGANADASLNVTAGEAGTNDVLDRELVVDLHVVHRPTVAREGRGVNT